jgi:hypothetical protein
MALGTFLRGGLAALAGVAIRFLDANLVDRAVAQNIAAKVQYKTVSFAGV